MKILNLNDFINESYYEETPDENELGYLLSECELKTKNDFIDYIKQYGLETVITENAYPWMKQIQQSGLYFTDDEGIVSDIQHFVQQCDEEADGVEIDVIVDNNDEIFVSANTIVCYENSNYVIVQFNNLNTNEYVLWIIETDK